jgi:SAM-dependent methyltransferase
MTLSPAAAAQRELWGGDPQAWADLAEAHNRPLFEALLDAAAVGDGTRVLDVGCGTGLALVLARERGAKVAGIDVTPGLLEIARRRLPGSDLREADMEYLPFPDGAFDVVLGVNSFQFAGDPLRAFAEAARVTRPGGLVAASLFAAPERSQSTVVHHAMSALSPPGKESEHAPFVLSAPGNLEGAMEAAGLALRDAGEVGASWRYETMDDALHGLLCSAGGARAIRDAGEPAVRAVLSEAMARFEDPRSGVVNMDNVFRWVLARRPLPQ